MRGVVDELSAEIERALGISAEHARQIALEACSPAPPGYHFVPLNDFPPELNEANAVTAARSFLRELPPCPETLHGRGVVICAGGPRLLRCAWVCIHMLRRFGCELPIELWHLGPAEMTDSMKRLIAPLGVDCVDGEQVRRAHPVRTLKGWELKSFALLHSRFAEMLLLDADNVPLTDPEFLFDAEEFAATGAIFWPDEDPIPPDSRIHELFGILPSGDVSLEVGQIVMEKRRSWGPLNLAMHFNEHSDFYYRYFHGDRGVFHLAWRFLQRPYSITPFPMRRLAGVMCQHDFTGRRIFQHRHGPKWDRPEHRVEGFEFEEECREYCRRLEQ